MGVYRKLKQTCFCGLGKQDWHECTCPRSDEFYVYFELMGKVIQQKLAGVTVEKEALRIERTMEQDALKGEGQKWVDFMEQRKCRDTFCRIGEILEAALDPSSGVFKNAKYARRYCQALLLVIARAQDLWITYDGAAKTFGRKIGTPIPDEARIRKLSSSVLDGELVRRYFRAVTGRLEWNKPYPENTSANSTLSHARCLFTEKMRTLKLDHLRLAPSITREGGFLRHALLPELEPEPEPFKETEFAIIVDAAEKLWTVPGKRHLAMINLALRETGMRSGSLAHLHQNWLEKHDAGWVLQVRKVKGGTAQYSIPVSDRFALMVLAPGRPFTLWTGEPGPVEDTGYLLPGNELARTELIKEHSAWIKTLVAATDTLSEQGNHRLRDTVASVCFSWLGREPAAEMLGNGREVNKRHYARLRINVSPLMKRELAHAQRLLHRPEHALAH